jgi:Cdc6-like AAA superfamily ATPase
MTREQLWNRVSDELIKTLADMVKAEHGKEARAALEGLRRIAEVLREDVEADKRALNILKAMQS